MRMAIAAVLGATLVSAAMVRLTGFAKATSVEKPDTTYPKVRGVSLHADREEVRGVRLHADRDEVRRVRLQANREEVRGVRLQPDRDPIERGTLRLHYV